MTNQSPRGGTEIQLEYLNKYCDKQLLDQVQITTSVPEKIPLHSTKLNILWQKNSWNQPNIYPWFKNKDNHKKYDWYVFNSHWNCQNFRNMFGLDTHRCIVIKNGIEKIEGAPSYKQKKPIKLLYHSTPWRGLSVLLGALQLVKNPLITLDVYSSTEIYGADFKKQNDGAYVELYEQAKKLPNVSYVGYKPHEYIIQNLKNYNMFVYPSIWEETSCISLIEAMSAGLYCITTNYGALFETGAEFPMYIPYDSNHRRLAIKFGQAIEMAAETLSEPPIIQHLKFQKSYTDIYYSWAKQASSWNRFLKGAIGVRKK